MPRGRNSYFKQIKGGDMALILEQQLAVAKLRNSELAAFNKIHEFRIAAETQLKTLQDEAQAQRKAMVEHLQGLAKQYNLDIEKVEFNFDTLDFQEMKK
jgi:hypothetical protein